jgi:NAD+ synthase (glutamine-hydrolysing)
LRDIPFFNPYHHNFVRVAVAVPEVRVADPAYNGDQTLTLLRKAAERQALLAVFPELGLSAYSCDDLFQQSSLLDGCILALKSLLADSQDLPVVGIVGMPIVIDHLLYNCAVVFYQGKILGVVPKTYLPNYREFYERRQFAPGNFATRTWIELCGQKEIPFGNRLLFQLENQPLMTFAAEICEDLWCPIPPSSYSALAGATVLVAGSAIFGAPDPGAALASLRSASEVAKSA